MRDRDQRRLRRQGGAYQGDGTACAVDLCPVVLEPFVDPLPLPAVAEPVSGEPGGEATLRHRDPAVRAAAAPRPAADDGVGLRRNVSRPDDRGDRRACRSTVDWINDLRDAKGELRDRPLPAGRPVPARRRHGDSRAPSCTCTADTCRPAFDGYPEDTFLPGELDDLRLPEQPAAGDALVPRPRARHHAAERVHGAGRRSTSCATTFEAGLGLPAGELRDPAGRSRIARSTPTARCSYPAAWQEHFFGDTILVNGKVWPYLDVKQRQVPLPRC